MLIGCNDQHRGDTLNSAPEPPTSLVERIYEAAIVTEQWPKLIAELAAWTGAKGGLLAAARQDGVTWVTAPQTEAVYRRFVDEGWHLQNERVPRLMARGHPGFLTDEDFYTEAERAALPIYAQFLTPLGHDAAAATAVAGLAGETMILSIEGFGSMYAARCAVARLDAARPHLARAGILAAKVGLERAKAAVCLLEHLGTAAGLAAHTGRLIAANQLFVDQLRDFGTDTARGIRLFDQAADAKVRHTLADIAIGIGRGASLPLRSPGACARVLHLLPIRGQARDVFAGAAAILVVARPGMFAKPDVGLIASLLDLTPAEARLAVHIGAGGTVAEAARQAAASEHTMRSHLKHIFSKTGLSRQAELVALLASLGRPGN